MMSRWIMRRPMKRRPSVLSRSYISIPDIVGLDYGTQQINLKNALAAQAASSMPRIIKQDGRFYCPWTSLTKKGLIDVVKYLMTQSQQKLKLSNVRDSRDLIIKQQVDLDQIRSVDQPHFTWIGHATCYYQTDGVRIITDPLFSERASPSQYFGPKRYVSTPVEIEDLPIDVVLLSHTHYDHLDERSARRIGNRALWIVPLGVKEVLRGMGISNAVELDWWQTYNFSPGSNNQANDSQRPSSPDPKALQITLTPAKHWTARTFWDRNTCLWGSFAVQAQQSSFFFTGDTAYCDVFKKIGEKFGGFDIAAIPIGAYSPRWFMEHVHCNPVEAVQIHLDLQSKESVGIHWGTFALADEDHVEPAFELSRARHAANISARNFYTLRHGETLRIGVESPKHDFATVNQTIYDEYLQFVKEHRQQFV